MNRPEPKKIKIGNSIAGLFYDVREAEEYFNYLEQENAILRRIFMEEDLIDRIIPYECRHCGCVHVKGSNTLCPETIKIQKTSALS